LASLELLTGRLEVREDGHHARAPTALRNPTCLVCSVIAATLHKLEEKLIYETGKEARERNGFMLR